MIQKTGDLKNIKGISDRDRKMIEEAEAMLGPEPGEMGFVKNMFWGNIRQELAFPYPEVGKEEKERCDAILAEAQGLPGKGAPPPANRPGRGHPGLGDKENILPGRDGHEHPQGIRRPGFWASPATTGPWK